MFSTDHTYSWGRLQRNKKPLREERQTDDRLHNNLLQTRKRISAGFQLIYEYFSQCMRLGMKKVSEWESCNYNTRNVHIVGLITVCRITIYYWWIYKIFSNSINILSTKKLFQCHWWKCWSCDFILSYFKGKERQIIWGWDLCSQLWVVASPNRNQETKTTCCSLWVISLVNTSKCLQRNSTVADQSCRDVVTLYPNNHLFNMLPSGRRFRSIKSKTNRLKNIFFPWTIRILNASGQWYCLCALCSFVHDTLYFLLCTFCTLILQLSGLAALIPLFRQLFKDNKSLEVCGDVWLDCPVYVMLAR